jgi:hypothetical protein
MTELVTVLVPLFNLPLTPLESFALKTYQAHLGDFPITFLKSENLPLSDELRAICPNADSVSYDPRYFVNRTGYTKLLLSTMLYEQFSWSRYLLILELNAAISKNELAYWCRQGYDFIQPFPSHTHELSLAESLRRRFNPTAYLTANSDTKNTFELNSGVSLRRVKAFQKLTERKKRAINQFLTDHPKTWNDASFWEYYVNRWRSELITPNALARHHFAQSQALVALRNDSTQVPFSLTSLDFIPVQEIE